MKLEIRSDTQRFRLRALRLILGEITSFRSMYYRVSALNAAARLVTRERDGNRL